MARGQRNVGETAAPALANVDHKIAGARRRWDDVRLENVGGTAAPSKCSNFKLLMLTYCTSFYFSDPSLMFDPFSSCEPTHLQRRAWQS